LSAWDSFDGRLNVAGELAQEQQEKIEGVPVAGRHAGGYTEWSCAEFKRPVMVGGRAR